MYTQNYKESTFTCKRDNFIIRGHILQSKEAHGLLIPVIISHGFMGNQNEARPEAEALAEAGYVAVIYDFVGGASDSESDGTPLDMTIFSEKEDLRVVMRYVQTLEYVDASRLVLIGCSQGGLVSGLIAVDVPEEVNRLILMYPALCIPDDARDGNMLMFHFDPTQIPDVIESEEFSLRGDYAKQVLDMDAINIISNYPGKVLVICGKEDLIVDYSYMTRIMTVFSSVCLMVKSRWSSSNVKITLRES